MIQTAELFFGLLTVLCQIFLALFLVLWVGGSLSNKLLQTRTRVLDELGSSALVLGWGVALVTVLGSLFFSEVAHFRPCLFCWIQRGLLYPQVLLFAYLILRPASVWVWRIAMTLALLDIPVSIYHHLIERYPSLEGNIECTAIGPSCTVPYFWVFNYLTLAVMALTSATTLAVLLYLSKEATNLASDSTPNHL